MNDNLLFTSDWYKWGHKNMYLPGTQKVISYFESRDGAMYPYTTFFGLQYLLKKWLIKPVTKEMIDEAAELADSFSDVPGVFDRSMWDYIVEKHDGKLPLLIKALPEGFSIPNSNVLITVENTDENCFWLTNAIETLLSHVWASSAVATRSRFMVDILKKYFKETSDNEFLAPYFLHDFSQRGVSSMESAGILGLAHLINSPATDSMMGAKFAKDYYHANNKGLGFSVKANEHSIATSKGAQGEFEVTEYLLKKFPNGILSLVSDSYSISKAVEMYCTELKSLILARNGKMVVRPDSPRFIGDTIPNQVLWITEKLWAGFGGTINSKGYKVLDPHCGAIYGDSVRESDMEKTLQTLKENGFSSENCVYGCGSYLSQKINRDTQRMAFKCSAQLRDNVWYDVFKSPLDQSKASKKGRLKLIRENGQYQTVNIDQPGEDILVPVFENGELLVDYTLDQVRANAKNENSSL